MKTFNLSDMEVVSVRVALSRRILDLRLQEISLKRLDLPCIAVHSEILLLDSLLSKLS